jgi:hypothetical protein
MAQGILKNYYLYRHIRLDTNEVFYIGVGTKNNKHLGFASEYKRAYDKNKRSKYWKNIVNKTNYTVEILFESTSLSFIYEKEREFISLYGRKDLKKGTLVNHNDGGQGLEGSKHTIETKQKISNSNKGRISGMLNKKHSEETKLKIKLGNIGKKLTLKQKETLSIANTGINNNRAKFTDDDIIEIRNKYLSGNFKQHELAKLFSTDQGTISSIVNRKKWKHIL